jgi:hypothetical protein
MTVHRAGYLVVLANDIREDDDTVLTALRMIKGVKSVVPVEADHAQVIARARLNYAWQDALRRLASDGPGDHA